MTTEAIRSLFRPEPGTVYLDAATYGLPPLPTMQAMEEALHGWQAGTAQWVPDWDVIGEECRALFATLIGAEAETIALVPTVSVGVGPVAASLPAGAEVVVPDDEFTSVLFPLLVAARERGGTVREAPLDALPEAITPRTRLVAFSLVQSHSGRTAPLSSICEAARAHGTQVLVDSTHATPFVPVASELATIDYLICHGYKHLLCPRGAGFLYVNPRRWDELAPYNANWRAGSPSYTRSIGGPLTLAPDAARFDVSLAWFSWVGARPSLELLARWQREGALAPVLDLAARLADRLGLKPPTSTLVTVPVADAEAAVAALDAAGVRAAARAGSIRLSPHVYNTPEDVERAAEALASVVAAVV